MPSFYQDRLGTDIEKALKNEWRFRSAGVALPRDRKIDGVDMHDLLFAQVQIDLFIVSFCIRRSLYQDRLGTIRT